MRQSIQLKTKDINFSIRVGGIVFDNQHRVLVQTKKQLGFWFFPGGHNELGESSPATIIREFQEELETEVVVERLIWVIENFYVESGTTFHELGFYYLISFPRHSTIYKKESLFTGANNDSNLLFKWHESNELMSVDLYPKYIRDNLVQIPNFVTHVVIRQE